MTKVLQNKTSENKFKIFVWTLFDFANTSYSIVIVTFLFAVYFKDTISKGEAIGDLYWSIGVSLSMIITALISPVLGAIADHSAGKKRFLLFFTILCIVSCAALYFTGEGTVLLAIILFTLANIGFEAGLVFYDAYLPEITGVKNYGRVSGYGYAMGYLGALITLAIVFPFIQRGMIKETFPVSALFFFVFSIPIFLVLKDTRKPVNKNVPFMKIGFQRVYYTLTHLKNYKNLSYFLIAFFFYIEGVNTVIFFSGNYAKTTLGFTFEELAIFFVIVQTTAILGASGFGIISDSLGQKKTLVITLLIWIGTIMLAYATSGREFFIIEYFSGLSGRESIEIQRYSFYLVGLLAGSVMGATQSTSRSLMSKLTPDEKKTEFFGFYSFFGKSSAILGPLVFGYVSYITNSQPAAVISISVFFIMGLIILSKVKDPKVYTTT
ncbi:MAG: MFS transporter [Melioribacteraceae bacterium]|nr:MFS transporter [Melioribacteraceae bacterium]